MDAETALPTPTCSTRVPSSSGTENSAKAFSFLNTRSDFLTVAAVAALLLGFQEHDIPVLIAAKLLRALGVKGHEAELRSASDEFSGHCLALTLLGSYLTDAYDGDIRCRKEVSERLGHDVRQGVHARKVMESYQTGFGEGPELSLLRMLGLFDRPVDEKALGALLNPPAIPGLTESVTDLSPTEWRTILARLRRARLLAGEDPHHRGYLDTHPTCS